MSISDPLIKDIKGYTLKFLESQPVTDSNRYLQDFCETIEKVFSFGLSEHYFNKKLDPFTWISAIQTSNFSLKNCLEIVSNRRNISTKLGRFRLFIRYCLVKKCLFVPVEYLLLNNRFVDFYTQSSILGDEILLQIFLSVLLQIGRIKFDLDVKNSSFLDFTWKLPEIFHLELVPCKNLGISVSFSREKALIMDVQTGSVAAENSNISVGDVLDSLNGITINSSVKGRLNSIFLLSKGQPVLLGVVKFYDNSTKDIFPPIRQIMTDLKVDPQEVKRKHSNFSEEPKADNNKSGGFIATFLGSVEIGNKGNVKEIEKAIRFILSAKQSQTYKYKISKKLINFEIGELGLKILDYKSNEIVLRHSYMEISSCGSGLYLPNYFAYIAGEKNCDIATKFTCFIFHSKNAEEACTILQSIGQGFHRTHFAV